jgi:hypothetical protein
VTGTGDNSRPAAQWCAWAPAVAAVLLTAALAAITARHRWWTAAHGFFPWMIDPLFHDLHIIRLGWQTVLAGGDPLADPANPYNYPRVVLAAASWGALRVPAGVAGVAVAAAFLAAVVCALRLPGRLGAVAASALVFSPPVLLMVERGNLDAVAFVLVAIGLAAPTLDLTPPLPAALAAVALLAAALLKLYPAAALAAGLLFWRDARRWWFGAGLVAFGAWAFLHLGEIALVLQKTTRGLEPSYGEALAGSRYYLEQIAPRVAADTGRAWLAAAMRLSMILYVGGAAAAILVGLRYRGRFAAGVTTSAHGMAFLTGAFIYGGTFILGANWAYRLVFLLFCLPLLWRVVQDPALRVWAVAVIAGIGVILFAPFHLPLPLFLAVQFTAWGTAWLLLAGAAGLLTAPRARPPS